MATTGLWPNNGACCLSLGQTMYQAGTDDDSNSTNRQDDDPRHYIINALGKEKAYTHS